MHTPGTPFTLHTRMSEALAERPALRELLPAFHPAFSRLNHPVMGRVLPRLVTVEDAARVAGVEPGALLAVMNLPGAEAHPAVPALDARVAVPPPIWLSAATPELLDARPLLAAGAEPFPVFMARFRELRPGAVLTALVDFEPAPLLRLMTERGWRTHGTWDGEVFRASFERPLELPDTPAQVPRERLSTDADGLTLDVRGLEPPEPLRLVLGVVSRPDGLPLRVLHDREPTLLFSRLAERGLRWELKRLGSDLVELRIDRA